MMVVEIVLCLLAPCCCNQLVHGVHVVCNVRASVFQAILSPSLVCDRINSNVSVCLVLVNFVRILI